MYVCIYIELIYETVIDYALVMFHVAFKGVFPTRLYDTVIIDLSPLSD